MLFWIGALVIAAVMSGLVNVLLRKANKEADPLSIAVLFNAFVSVAYVPLLFLEEFSLPLAQVPFILLAAAMWFFNNVLSFYAFKHTAVTLMQPLKRTSVLFVAALSFFLLGEQLSTLTIVGTLLFFIGIAALSWNRKEWGKLTWIGAGLTILSAALTGFTAIVDKVNMVTQVSPALYGMLMFLLPGMGFTAIAFKRQKQLAESLKQWKIMAGVGVLTALYFWIYLNAYKALDLSIAYPITKLNLLFAMGIAYYWLKEKQDFRNRVIGAVIILVGAVLVTLGA